MSFFTSVILPIFAICAAVFNIAVCLTVLIRKRFVFNCAFYSGEFIVADSLLVMLLRSSVSPSRGTFIFLILALIWILFLLILNYSGQCYYRIYGTRPSMNKDLDEKLSELNLENNVSSENCYFHTSDPKAEYSVLIVHKAKVCYGKKVSKQINSYLTEKGARSFAPVFTAVINVLAILIVLVGII